jgi:hypothetical protein
MLPLRTTFPLWKASLQVKNPHLLNQHTLLPNQMPSMPNSHNTKAAASVTGNPTLNLECMANPTLNLECMSNPTLNLECNMANPHSRELLWYKIPQPMWRLNSYAAVAVESNADLP